MRWSSKSIVRVMFEPGTGSFRASGYSDKRPPTTVDDHIPGTIDPTQEVVVDELDPALSDHVAALEILIRFEILGGDFSDVTEHVCGQSVVAVVPPLLDLDRQCRVEILVTAQGGDLRHRQILEQWERLGDGDVIFPLDPAEDFLRLELERVRHEREHSLLVARIVLENLPVVAAEQAERICGAIIDENLAVPVEDQASFGGDLHLPEAIAFRQASISVCLDALDVPERSRKEDEGEDDQPYDEVDPERQDLLVGSISSWSGS